MKIYIKYVKGVNDPSEETYTDVYKLKTIDCFGYKRVVFSSLISTQSIPHYLIDKIEIIEEDCDDVEYTIQKGDEDNAEKEDSAGSAVARKENNAR